MEHVSLCHGEVYFGYIPRSGSRVLQKWQAQFSEELPHWFPEWLYQLAILPAVEECSSFSTSPRYLLSSEFLILAILTKSQGCFDLVKKSGESRCWRGCGERGTLLHCWWNCKMVQPLWKSVWRFLRNLGMTLLEDPAIPLLGIYPEDSLACNKDTCSTMFIAALLVIARSWKEPRCPSTEEWIQKM